MAGICDVCTGGYWTTYTSEPNAYIQRIVDEFYNVERVTREVQNGDYWVALNGESVVGAGGSGMISGTEGGAVCALRRTRTKVPRYRNVAVRCRNSSVEDIRCRCPMGLCGQGKSHGHSILRITRISIPRRKKGLCVFGRGRPGGFTVSTGYLRSMGRAVSTPKVRSVRSRGAHHDVGRGRGPSDTMIHPVRRNPV